MQRNDVLDYIKLDLKKIPKRLLENNNLHFNTYKNLNTYKIYEYVSVHDLEILITPLDRTAELKERMKNAKTLSEYLTTDDKKMINTFNEILNGASVEEIQKLEKMQKAFENKIPYLVRYDKNYLWQIYYSSQDNKYFMLFPANEGETSVLFYIIKKKLERKDTKIYVPVCKQSFSEKILNNTQINEIENYLWLFTENWPNIYEVCQNNLYITGKTKVGEIIESDYRNVFSTRAEAEDYFKLLKALFILTTETNYLYTFKPYIDDDGSLKLKYEENILSIENLKQFIASQIDIKKKSIACLKQNLEEQKKALNEIKEYIKKQNEIYVMQEKQIVMFLQCKKSFFKKISYFFKSKKFIIPKIDIKINNDKVIQKQEIEESYSYNIKELIDVTIEENLVSSKIKAIKADIEALKIKKENLNRKIKNANIYISEIEKHKKSIFEFWKFSNKDSLPELGEGEEVKKINSKDETKSLNLIRNFKIEEDLDLLGQKMDRIQRDLLSENEINTIYNLKYYLDTVKDINDEEELKKLLAKINEDEKRDEMFDDVLDSYTSIIKINNRECRETKRNPFNQYLVNKEMDIYKLKKVLLENKKVVDNALDKIKSIASLPIFIKNVEKENSYIVGEIKAEKIINQSKDDITLYKLNLNIGDNAIFLTNIIFFNNKNDTLPLGMNIETKVLTRMPKFVIKNSKEEFIQILSKENEFDYKIRKIKIVSLNK